MYNAIKKFLKISRCGRNGRRRHQSVRMSGDRQKTNRRTLLLHKVTAFRRRQ